MVCFGCSSGQLGQPTPAFDDEPTALAEGEARLLPVVSAASGLFIVLGRAAPDSAGTTSRREYIGYGAELVILSRAGTAPSAQYTLVSEARHCVASARGRVSLWFAGRGDDTRLTEPVDALEIDGCEELEFGEWLVALDGARETARWQAPLHLATVEGSAEVSRFVSSLRGEEHFMTIEDAAYLARFHLVGTDLSALAISSAPINGHLSSSSVSCETQRHVAISLVREAEVVVAFEAGEHLGVLTVGEASFVVYLGTHRNKLRAWQVHEQGLELVTDTERPVYRERHRC